MFKSKFFIYFAITAIYLFSFDASGYSVGATPLISNFGTISKGEIITNYIFVATDSTEKIVLSTNYIQPHYNVFMESGTGEKFKYNPQELSFEEVSSWVEIKDDIKFSSSSSVSIPVPEEYNLDPNAVIPVKISVPLDAEPGIHVLSISMSSNFPKRIGRPTVNLVALTRPSIIFRVPGKVSIDGEISQMEGRRTNKNSVYVDYHVKNTGTITVPFEVKAIKIYDEYDDIIFEKENLGTMLLGGGDLKKTTLLWSDREEITDGKYKIKIALDVRGKKIYKTGFIIVTSDISPAGIATEDGDNIISKDVSAKTCSTYWFWIIFASALIALIYYNKQEYAQKEDLLKAFVASFIIILLLNYLYCLLI